MLTVTGISGLVRRSIIRVFGYRDRTGVRIGRGSSITRFTTIGDGSRFNGKIVIKGKGQCSIGKYCAFGDGIKIILSNHQVEAVNVQYALAKKIGLDVPISRRRDTFIGHNVWVGDNCLILAGVRIGNGAIIGAGSVVTRDVAAYSVVAGSPAKELRKRFDEERIRLIEESAWWNWSLEEMRANRTFFQSLEK